MANQPAPLPMAKLPNAPRLNAAPLAPTPLQLAPTPSAPAHPMPTPAAQPTVQPMAQPTAQPTAQPVAQPVAQPTAQTAPQPMTQSTAQPVAQPTAQPVAQPTAQTAPQPMAQSTAQPAAQPVTQPTSQPVAQPTSTVQPTTPHTAPTHPHAQTTFAQDFKLPDSVLTSKSITTLLGAACFLGLLLGGMIFGGGEPVKKVTGLQGVVRNTDITAPLPRCGRTDRGRSCILYVVNHTRYDKIAEDFFDDAVLLTEIQKYSISMANPKYAKTRIPPGYFAEIKIPDIR